MAGAGARNLMVDDDPGIRDVVSDFLGRHGYKVETAADAAEMDRVLERGPVDLIVLDIMMPGEDVRFVPGHGPMSTFGQERKTNPFVADQVLADE